MLRRAILMWLMMASAETVQGTFRRLLIEPAIGARPADVCGLAVGTAFVLLIAWCSADYVGARAPADRLKIGGAWVLLTLAYEVAIGRLLGLSWGEIVADYDLADGGLLPLGLFAMLFAPMVVDAIRSLRDEPSSSSSCEGRDP